VEVCEAVVAEGWGYVAADEAFVALVGCGADAGADMGEPAGEIVGDGYRLEAGNADW
jgi:hypothetical protein